MSYKEIILSNIIGLNPTGILDFNGTYNMKGNNNIVRTSAMASKENLIKAQNNKIICDHVENFENYNINNINNINSINKYNYMKIFIILLILLFFLIIIKF